MNLATLAWSYLRAKPLGTFLNVLLLALGVGTISFVRIVDGQIGERLLRDVRGIDLVVGAKGSALQLILAGIYHLDAPAGNIPFGSVQELSGNPLVRQVIPLSLGDSFRGFRIVGTTPAYLELYGGRLESGNLWHGHLAAVLGSTVAKRTGLVVGDRFAGSHGLSDGGAEHADNAYSVAGVLRPTGSVLDRLVVVDTKSVWQVHSVHGADGAAPKGHGADSAAPTEHDDDRQVTLLLVRYATPLAAVSLARRINAETNLQAASPAYESARLFRMIGVGADVIRAFGGVVLATASLSLFIALYHALHERTYDIAVLRTLGARPSGIAAMLMLEALMLALFGGFAGLVLAHALVAVLAWWTTGQESLSINAWTFSFGELWLLWPALLAAALAALLPGWRAARANISATLARRQ